MSKYLVDYYETYSKSYEIEAGSKEEAEEESRHCNSFTQGLHLATVKIEWEE